MNFGDMVKSDFEEIFLVEEGQKFSIIRVGSKIAEVIGIYRQNKIQFKAEEDIEVGDELQAEFSETKHSVKAITFEIVGNVRTCLEAHI